MYYDSQRRVSPKFPKVRQNPVSLIKKACCHHVAVKRTPQALNPKPLSPEKEPERNHMIFRSHYRAP